MKNPDKFLNAKQASEIITQLGTEFAIVKNPDYIHPPFEIYPLAPKISTPIERLVAAVMDMDGTTTTTETLCIHSLEFMVRKITDRLSKNIWQGLDPLEDYPHIIGNSTTKHVEYLVQKYASFIKPEALKQYYLDAALWFLFSGKDKRRVEEARNNLINLGCQELLNDERLHRFRNPGTLSDQQLKELKQSFLTKHGSSFRATTFSDKVRAAIDIYYQRYHEILNSIHEGKREQLSAELLGRANLHLIDPMPGMGEFLALIKGWLGEEIIHLVPKIFELYQKSDSGSIHQIDLKKVESNLKELAIRFQRHPLKVAVVTSSIFYEAEIVITEVFRVLQRQVEHWLISQSKKEMIMENFSDYKNVYDGFVTASDSSEIRLKPHRDLYSIALHQLGIPKDQFNQVVGFEDSESGTIAIRVAGIGLCVAVPFSDTQHHDLQAAAYILKSGLPEAMVRYNLFLKI